MGFKATAVKFDVAVTVKSAWPSPPSSNTRKGSLTADTSSAAILSPLRASLSLQVEDDDAPRPDASRQLEVGPESAADDRQLDDDNYIVDIDMWSICPYDIDNIDLANVRAPTDGVKFRDWPPAHALALMFFNSPLLADKWPDLNNDIHKRFQAAFGRPISASLLDVPPTKYSTREAEWCEAVIKELGVF